MTGHGREDVALSLEDVSAFYGQVAAVRGVTLRVARGQAVGILGPNGAGKSSLLAAVAGFLRTTGEVSLGDQSLRRASVVQRRRAGLSMVPQLRAVVAELTVGENLRLSWLTGTRASSFSDLRDRVLDVFPALRHRTAEAAGNLSGGQRQMLAVGRGLMAAPEVLMLDEPTAGLSPKLIGELVAAIRELNASGVTLLLVEQNFSAVERSCDEVHVLNGGVLTWHGRTDEIDRATVGDLYAGTTRRDT